MFWLRNKKNNFQLRTFIWGPVATCDFPMGDGPDLLPPPLSLDPHMSVNQAFSLLLHNVNVFVVVLMNEIILI